MLGVLAAVAVLTVLTAVALMREGRWSPPPPPLFRPGLSLWEDNLRLYLIEERLALSVLSPASFVRITSAT